MDERLTELETKVMFQDRTIEELNQVICDQQRQLDGLAAEVTLLKKRLAALLRMADGDHGGDLPEPGR
ncbi:MAG: SlyX family protein [Desulfobulbaceae bacterium]|nr:SlyX family protein [Desulfobulbaceae bacterium]